MKRFTDDTSNFENLMENFRLCICCYLLEKLIVRMRLPSSRECRCENKAHAQQTGGTPHPPLRLGECLVSVAGVVDQDFIIEM